MNKIIIIIIIFSSWGEGIIMRWVLDILVDIGYDVATSRIRISDTSNILFNW